jgi:hypothetical protein
MALVSVYPLNTAACLSRRGVTVLLAHLTLQKPLTENNAENLLVIHDAAVAAKYEQNWQTQLIKLPRCRPNRYE